MTEQTEITDVENDDVDNSPEDGVETVESVETEPETFPREYVERLRSEAAEARVKAKRTDDLAHRLHGALVAATGRLADPSDLPFEESHLEDETALEAALDDLLARKPHLASRRPRGDVGQGVGPLGQTANLAGILRSRA